MGWEVGASLRGDIHSKGLQAHAKMEVAKGRIEGIPL